MKRAQLIIVVAAVLVISVLWHRHKKVSVSVSAVADEYVYRKPARCPGPTQEFEMRDPYMRGFIEPGARFRVILGYYECHRIERGDLVLFQGREGSYPRVKIARAVGGDTYQIVSDRAGRGWNLVINKKMVMDGDRAYFFGAKSALPPLALYAKSHGSQLRGDEALLLSSWAPGDLDSTVFGVYKTDVLIGKVVR